MASVALSNSYRYFILILLASGGDIIALYLVSLIMLVFKGSNSQPNFL